jgi:tetratricopeptide (TPR) repeat protein
MKKMIIKMMVLLLLFNGSFIQADDSDSLYDKAKTYSQEKIHDMTTEDITFESFYKESIEIDWVDIGIDVLFLDATSLIADISKKVAISIGEEIVLSYAFNTYSYSNFSEESKNLKTLPLPKNISGSNTYENAINILKDIDNEKPLYSEENQKIIEKALSKLSDISKEEYAKAQSILDEMGVVDIYNNPERFNNANDIVERYEDKEIKNDEKSKEESLSSLLYFILNHYQEAKEHAYKSIELANKENVKHTISSYIYATSSLYDETFNYDVLAEEYLKYSFLEEPDNPLIPLLLSIHMERMMYRYSDGMISEKSLTKVFNIVSNESLKDFRIQNYSIILSFGYLNSLMIEEQKISSLTQTENKTIKNSIKTLETVKKSYKNYEDLLSEANKVISALNLLEIEDESKEQITNFKNLIKKYDNDKTRLQGLIQDLETYQDSLSIDEIVQANEVKVVTDTKDKNIYLYIGLGIMLFALIGFLMTRRKEEI